MIYFLSLPADDEELETEGMIDPGVEYTPPSCSSHVGRKKLCSALPHIKQEAESEDEDGRELEDNAREAAGCGEVLPLPSRGAVNTGAAGRHRVTHPEKPDAVADSCRCRGPAPLSLYEERMLLRRLDACPLALAATPQAKRLRRKLLVRQAKRQRGLPLLDMDRAVRAALSLVGGIYGAQEAGPHTGGGVNGKYCTNSQEQRILDRFQVSRLSLLKNNLFV